MPVAIRYPLLNLFARPGRALATIAGVGLVAAVLCYLLCLSTGLRDALLRNADPRILIVLAEASTAESNSALALDDIHRLTSVPGLDTDDHGRPLVSPELVVMLGLARRSDPSGSEANVLVRGVEGDVAQAVHREVRLVAGRWFRPGADELVVGAAAARQFSPGSIGTRLVCGSRTFEIVGEFAAAGTAHESEFWGPRPNVAAAFQRAGLSSAALRLSSASPDSARVALSAITGAAIGLRAFREPDYFAGEAGNARLLEGLAAGLASVMGLGAIFAALNTMYAAVAARTREIGMLRAIGFTPRRILVVFVGEALALALLGGFLGCLLCALRIWTTHGLQDLVGSSNYTAVAFQLRLAPTSVALALAVAALIGLIGGFAPARAASRLPVPLALRAV